MDRRYNELEAKAYLTECLNGDGIHHEEITYARFEHDLSLFQVQSLVKEVRLLHDIENMKTIADARSVLERIVNMDWEYIPMMSSKHSIQMARLRKRKRMKKRKRELQILAEEKRMRRKFKFTGRVGNYGHLVSMEDNLLKRYIDESQMEFHQMSHHPQGSILTLEIFLKDGEPSFQQRGDYQRIVNIESLRLMVLS